MSLFGKISNSINAFTGSSIANSLAETAGRSANLFFRSKLGASPLMDGLNPYLIAQIYEVDHKGTAVLSSNKMIMATFTEDVNLEATFNWQSPFESAGPESKAPALMSMLQSGALQSLAESIGGVAKEKMQGSIDAARGRTGITKLNSTQVFSGMPPVRIQANLLLRAWKNPELEVEQPLDTLMSWALPKQLAAEGTLLSNAIDYAKGSEKTLIETAMPSLAPTLIALTYKGRTYSPLVIETIGIPLGSPIDASGRFVELVIPITFATLTAIDASDWLKTRY